MLKVISFDMDGTLVNSDFVDKVWMEGMPILYAERHGMDFDLAREKVISEYMSVGSDHLEWYDLLYWIKRFDLHIDKDHLLESYSSDISLFPDVKPVLEKLADDYRLVVTSNAAREFIDIELDSIADLFDTLFSVTSDFRDVKKSSNVYTNVCKHLGVKELEVMHIGDHYIYDYESAIDAGLDALFLDRKCNRQGSEVIWDLNEVIEHLNYS